MEVWLWMVGGALTLAAWAGLCYLVWRDEKQEEETRSRRRSDAGSRTEGSYEASENSSGC